MKDNFDLRKFLTENKLTPNSRVLNEDIHLLPKNGKYVEWLKSQDNGQYEEYLEKLKDQDAEENIEQGEDGIEYNPDAEKAASLDALMSGEFQDEVEETFFSGPMESEDPELEEEPEEEVLDPREVDPDLNPEGPGLEDEEPEGEEYPYYPFHIKKHMTERALVQEEAPDLEDMEPEEDDIVYDPEAEKAAKGDAKEAGELEDDELDFEDNGEEGEDLESEEGEEEEDGNKTTTPGRDGKWAEAALARALRVAQTEVDEFGYKKLYLCWERGRYFTSAVQKGIPIAVVRPDNDPEMMQEKTDLTTVGYDTGKRSVFEIKPFDPETGEEFPSPYEKVQMAPTLESGKKVIINTVKEFIDLFPKKLQIKIVQDLGNIKSKPNLVRYVTNMILKQSGLGIDPKLSSYYQGMKKKGAEKGSGPVLPEPTGRKTSYIAGKDYLEEISHEDFHSREAFQILRDAIYKNQLVGVAFVKKDGSVKHMLMIKSMSMYRPSTTPKSDAQQNINKSGNSIRGIDFNAYKRELQANGGDKEAAAKASWRTISLDRVLGFAAKGEFYDLRDENKIKEIYGEEVYNSITPAMTRSIKQAVVTAEPEIEDNQNTKTEMNENKGNFDLAKFLVENKMTEISRRGLLTEDRAKLTPREVAETIVDWAGSGQGSSSGLSTREAQQEIGDQTKGFTEVELKQVAKELESYIDGSEGWNERDLQILRRMSIVVDPRVLSKQTSSFEGLDENSSIVKGPQAQPKSNKLQEQKGKDAKYVVKKCKEGGYSVWEGKKKVKHFEDKVKAKAYADKQNEKQDEK